MINASRSSSLHVTLLRVNGPSVDPQSTKLHAASLLAGADLCPASVSPSAIVCIRKLRDPMPGRLSLNGHGLRPPIDWQRAVSNAIDAHARRAVRPLREFVPADADCVVFNDRAELLACLAKDWSEGTAAFRWWWQALLPREKPLRAAPLEWLKSPEYLPGAWRHLANVGHAVPFAARLHRDEVLGMLHGISEQFVLPELQSAISSIRDEWRSLVVESLQPRNTPGLVAPWQRWAVEADDASLTVEQRLLVGIALSVQRVPGVVRTSGFARAVRQWLKTTSTVARHDAPASRESAGAPQRQGEGDSWHSVPMGDLKRENERSNKIAPVDAGLPGRTEKPIERVTPDTLRPQTGQHLNAEGRLPAPSGVVRNDEPFSEPATSPPVDRFQPEGNPESQAALQAETVFDIEAAPPTEPDLPMAEPVLEEQITTGCGGIFYLLNLAHYLELYGDITTPWIRDLPLGIWDFLALLGEKLIGDELRRDPLWLFLAGLAGEGDRWQPGAASALPENWRAPLEWLRPFEDEEAWSWSASAERLAVWHPAGFLVLDVALEPGDPSEQLRREMNSYAALSPRLCPGIWPDFARPDFDSTPVSRWMEWLARYVRARLQRALGMADPGEVGPALCRSGARVFVTTTHLDVVFSLADLMIEIRLAGLDRDPGWIPATGRITRFHFEG